MGMGMGKGIHFFGAHFVIPNKDCYGSVLIESNQTQMQTRLRLDSMIFVGLILGLKPSGFKIFDPNLDPLSLMVLQF